MSSDLHKVYLFASKDDFSFSHIDHLIRAVAERMFTILAPPNIHEKDLNQNFPILNYGNKKELDDLIERGIFKKENVYNLPSKLINAVSKVEFHKHTKGLTFIPKTVFSLEEAKKLKFPIIAKTERGSKGVGVEQYKTLEDLEKSKIKHDVFCEKFDLVKEFRCISIKGEVIFIAERIPINKKAKSLRESKDIFDKDGTLSKRSSYDWKNIEMGKKDIPEKKKFESVCKAIHEALGLDFLGVDIGLDSKGKLWCIEANTCPGLNKDQIVLIYENIFKDFYERNPDEATQKQLDSFKQELMRANEDPAKFSHSPHMGRRFYYYDEFQPDNKDTKKSILTVKYDIEKSFGKPLRDIKKDLGLKENNTSMRYLKPFSLFEQESTGLYSTEDMDNFVEELIDKMEWNGKNEIHVPATDHRNAASIATDKEKAESLWNEAVDKYKNDDSIKWYVWFVDAGGSFNKIKEIASQRYDIHDILKMLRKYPDAIRRIKISIASKEQTSFNNNMSQEYKTNKWSGD